MAIFQFLKTVISCLKAIMPLSGCSNPLMTGSSLTFNLCSTVTSSEILFQFNQHNQGLSLSITYFLQNSPTSPMRSSASIMTLDAVCAWTTPTFASSGPPSLLCSPGLLHPQPMVWPWCSLTSPSTSLPAHSASTMLASLLFLQHARYAPNLELFLPSAQDALPSAFVLLVPVLVGPAPSKPT